MEWRQNYIEGVALDSTSKGISLNEFCKLGIFIFDIYILKGINYIFLLRK